MITLDLLFAAIFCFTLVFGLLAGLYILLKFLTAVIRFIEAKIKKEQV